MSYSKDRDRIKSDHRKQLDNKNNEISYERLKDSASKRFHTVFVGAIAKIEEGFGYLWGGDDIEESDMTPEQKKYFQLFLDIRERIFDQGNSQRERFLEELKGYNVSKVRQEIVLIEDKDKNERKN